MFNVILLAISGIAAWTAVSLSGKGNYNSEIREVLANILDGCKYVLSGVKDLVKLLLKDSFESKTDKNLDGSDKIKDSVIELFSESNSSKKEDSKAA